MQDHSGTCTSRSFLKEVLKVESVYFPWNRLVESVYFPWNRLFEIALSTTLELTEGDLE